METHNTREVDEWEKEFDAQFEWTDFDGNIGSYVLIKKQSSYALEETERAELKAFIHHQLQKARQDWLREEIGRLEGMKIKESHIGINGLYTAQVEMEVNEALQTIIDRYQAELDQDVSK